MMTPTHDTAAALEAAIDAYGNATAREAENADERAALHRAITAHVEAEVTRRLAGAPDVEAAIAKIVACTDLMDNVGSARARDALRAAIAADKARAVEAARPTPDEARRLVDEAIDAVRSIHDRADPYRQPAVTALLRAPAERRPCAGWVTDRRGWNLLHTLVGDHGQALASVDEYEDGRAMWSISVRAAKAAVHSDDVAAASAWAAMLAAEDALRAIAAEILRAVGA